MVNLGQYIPRQSPIHGLDPRVKILSVVLLSLMVLNTHVLTASMISLFLLALVPVSCIPFSRFLCSFKPVLPFFLLLFLLHLLLTRGTPIPPFPPWRVTVTWEGLFKGTIVTWQFALLIMSASFLTMTTTPSGLVTGLERLLRPFRFIGVPSHDVAVMVSVALRFVPTILQEMRNIREAQTARGADFGTGSPYRRMRAVIALLIPLISNTFRKADDLATAMEGRGYGGGPRTSMHELHLTSKDFLAVAVMSAVVAVCLFHPHLFSLFTHSL